MGVYRKCFNFYRLNTFYAHAQLISIRVSTRFQRSRQVFFYHNMGYLITKWLKYKQKEKLSELDYQDYISKHIIKTIKSLILHRYLFFMDICRYIDLNII